METLTNEASRRIEAFAPKYPPFVFFVVVLIVGIAGCSAPRAIQPARSMEPPPSYNEWGKLTWLQTQLDGSEERERATLLVRMAELYVAVDRPDKAGLSAREALYAAGGESQQLSNSIGSRARSVLGAKALLHGDTAAARRELQSANSIATNDVERSVANALLAKVELKESNAALASSYRSRVALPNDPRVLELTKPFNIIAAPPIVQKTQSGSQPAPANVTNPEIRIIPRSQWKPAPTGSDTEPMGKSSRITVHHEAKEFNGATLDDTLRQIRNIQEYHQRGRKWADIGYHFLIDRIGNIIEGRSIALQGAHAGERNKKGESPNSGNIGISLL
ncbi:MAG: N-acetylmuramoyl-L-alanine amidase, partial [Planctomycetota bacterium]